MLRKRNFERCLSGVLLLAGVHVCAEAEIPLLPEVPSGNEHRFYPQPERCLPAKRDGTPQSGHLYEYDQERFCTYVRSYLSKDFTPTGTLIVEINTRCPELAAEPETEEHFARSLGIKLIN